MRQRKAAKKCKWTDENWAYRINRVISDEYRHLKEARNKKESNSLTIPHIYFSQPREDLILAQLTPRYLTRDTGRWSRNRLIAR